MEYLIIEVPPIHNTDYYLNRFYADYITIVLVIYRIYKYIEYNMNVFEYICVDSDNKFRSKIIINDSNIEDVAPIVISSSLIENSVNIYDVVLYPVKVIRNPNYRDDNHWIVLTECKYPNNTLHKNNTRCLLENTIKDNNDTEIGISQEFVLFENEKPIGWDDEYNIAKNNTGKNEFSQHSEKIVNSIIDALIYSEIPVASVKMQEITGKWHFTFNTTNAVEACDNVILFRYIAQKICFQHNIVFNLHNNPVNNRQCASRCEFSISTPAMRDIENGLQNIVDVCEKIKLKHLLNYSSLSPNNSKKFTYSQKNDEQCIQVVMQDHKSGFIRDRRCGSDCDPYKVLELLLSNIINSYSINNMAHDLVSLKHRFNYNCIIGDTKLNTSLPLLHQKEVPIQKAKKSVKNGFAGLADILNISHDEDEATDIIEHIAKKPSKKSRIDDIINGIQNINITHNILNSGYVPKNNVIAQSKSVEEDEELAPSSLYTLASEL